LAVWKVPRQCPLVLLVKDLINFDLKDVGAAVVGGMKSDFGRAILWRKILKSEYLEGCMRSMQCNAEFRYQLSIRSGTKENHGKP
jgi:hypothetical protein